jgi:hypothetical protein
LCGGVQAASTNTNTLAIVLLRNAPAGLNDGKVDLSEIKLADKPLFADRDFVRYDRRTHTFAVTAESVRRMVKEFHPDQRPRKVDGKEVYELSAGAGRGEPFAWVINGEIIYLGVFYSFYSSQTPYPLPRIDVSELVPVEGKEPVSFEIKAERSALAEPFVYGKDVRADPRIMRALSRLGI